MEKVIIMDSYIDDKIYEILNTPKYTKIIDALTPHGTFLVDIVAEPKLCDLCTEVGADRFIKGVKRTLFGILKDRHLGVPVEIIFDDIQIRIVDSTQIKLHDITPKYSGVPITFNCEILGVDERKVYLQEATFVCPKCSISLDMKCDAFKLMKPMFCDNKSECRRCKMEILGGTEKTGYVQTLLIQEPMEEAINNTPIQFIAKIRDIDVGTVFPGQRKKITAVFRMDTESKKNEYDIVLEVVGIVDLEEVNQLMPSETELNRLKEASTHPDFSDKLVDCFAPHIYGYRDIKKAIILQLIGGVRTNKRGEINMLLVGDPSMAKSELLKEAKKITQKSIYASGKGSSAAGLTAGMVKLPNGTSIARLGVYPLCHRGYALIDEFDKMNADDRSGLHEAMEQGTVSLAKAGVNMTVPAEVTTLAAANPIYGRYDIGLSLVENIDLPPALLSRFDLIWLVVDKIDDVSDTFKAKHVLASFGKKKKGELLFLDSRGMMSYINYVKALTPELSDDARAKLLSLYKKMRGLSKSEKNAIPVGIRQLEALVRLCMAHAKMMFKEQVDVNDVEAIIDIFKASYNTFGIDMETGKFDQMVLSGVTEKETKIQTAYRIWNQLKDERGEVDTRVFIDALALENKFNENSARSLIQEWTKNGIIRLAVSGKWILA